VGSKIAELAADLHVRAQSPCAGST
jgi:hypothetical protein